MARDKAADARRNRKAMERRWRLSTTTRKRKKSDSCYIATAVYGNYDCPEVWTLRRFRDYYLAKSVLGRAFIKIYYFISPKFIKIFGKTRWFNTFFRDRLDVMVKRLNQRGYSSEKYEDIHE